MPTDKSPHQPAPDKSGNAEDSSQDAAAEVLTAPPPIPKTSYELRILQSLRRIIQSIEIHSRKLAQNHQITGPQLGCLLVLQENGLLTITALAKQVYLRPSTVVGIVDRLEEKGLLSRSRSASDRRQVQISLTESGEKLVENAPSPLQDTLSEGLKELPELEQVSITLALEKVVDLMEARKIEAAPVLTTGPISAAPAKKPPTSDTP